MGDNCKTKYPLLLLHGAGFRDLKKPVYWGRIPGALEKRGCEVYFGNQDCWGSTETNAEAIRTRIGEVLARSGRDKVNIIAHSKGGLDARMAASSLGCGAWIASLTTVATPHRGSRTLDRLFRAAKPAFSAAAFAVNNWIRLVGDKKPDFLRLCEGLTTEAMERFNEANPDVPGICYQSFACVMKHPFSDLNLSTANFILNRLEGPNDGLVSVESALWGPNARVLRARGFRGLSHLDAIDLYRSPMSRRTGPGVGDICEFYTDLVRDLRDRGY